MPRWAKNEEVRDGGPSLGGNAHDQGLYAELGVRVDRRIAGPGVIAHCHAGAGPARTRESLRATKPRRLAISAPRTSLRPMQSSDRNRISDGRSASASHACNTNTSSASSSQLHSHGVDAIDADRHPAAAEDLLATESCSRKQLIQFPLDGVSAAILRRDERRQRPEPSQGGRRIGKRRQVQGVNEFQAMALSQIRGACCTTGPLDPHLVGNNCDTRDGANAAAREMAARLDALQSPTPIRGRHYGHRVPPYRAESLEREPDRLELRRRASQERRSSLSPIRRGLPLRR